MKQVRKSFWRLKEVEEVQLTSREVYSPPNTGIFLSLQCSVYDAKRKEFQLHLQVTHASKLKDWKSLVLRSSSLASLELVEVPAADGEGALVLVHTLAEVGDIGLASSRCLVGLALVGVGVGCLLR